MNGFFGWLSRLVTVRPYITILVLVIITALLAAGVTRRAPTLETTSTLPVCDATAFRFSRWLSLHRREYVFYRD